MFATLFHSKQENLCNFDGELDAEEPVVALVVVERPPTGELGLQNNYSSGFISNEIGC